MLLVQPTRASCSLLAANVGRGLLQAIRQLAHNNRRVYLAGNSATRAARRLAACSQGSADYSSAAEGRPQDASFPSSTPPPAPSAQLSVQPPKQQPQQAQQGAQAQERGSQEVVLRGPEQLYMDDIENAKWAWYAGAWLDSQTKAAVASQAAALDSAVQSVRLESFGWESDLVLACLALLPAGITHLNLATRVAGPLPAVLERFSRLESLVISGDGAQVDWCCHGSAEAINKLSQLRVNFTEADIDCCPGPWTSILAVPVPAHFTQLLRSHGTQLRHPSVEAKWSGDLAELCRSLPSLSSLRLGLLEADQEAMAEAVALLRELTQVPELTLSVDDGAGSDDEDFTHDDDSDEWDFKEGEQEPDEKLGGIIAMTIPPLTGIPNLVGLEVRRHVAPPPDWRQLSSLASLELHCRAGGIPDWSLPVAGLASLTCLRIDCDTLDPQRGGALPPALCHLPALRHLALKPPNWWGSQQKVTLKLPPEFTQLTALTRLDTWTLSPEAERLLREQMPQVSLHVTDDPW